MSYVALANITLGSSASSVTFSSIPNTFRDLVLVVNAGASQRSYTGIRFNSDSGTNYSNVRAAYESTSSPTSDTLGTDWIAGFVINGDITSMQIYNIMDYSATDKHKTSISRSSSSDYYVAMQAGRWANTAAITSITAVVESSRTWDAGSTFALYGIAS